MAGGNGRVQGQVKPANRVDRPQSLGDVKLSAQILPVTGIARSGGGVRTCATSPA